MSDNLNAYAEPSHNEAWGVIGELCTLLEPEEYFSYAEDMQLEKVRKLIAGDPFYILKIHPRVVEKRIELLALALYHNNNLNICKYLTHTKIDPHRFLFAFCILGCSRLYNYRALRLVLEMVSFSNRLIYISAVPGVGTIDEIEHVITAIPDCSLIIAYIANHGCYGTPRIHHMQWRRLLRRRPDIYGAIPEQYKRCKAVQTLANELGILDENYTPKTPDMFKISALKKELRSFDIYE